MVPDRKRDQDRIRGASERPRGHREEPSFQAHKAASARPAKPAKPTKPSKPAKARKPRKPLLPPGPPKRRPERTTTSKWSAAATMLTVTTLVSLGAKVVTCVGRSPEPKATPVERTLRESRKRVAPEAHEALEIRGDVVHGGWKGSVAGIRMQLAVGGRVTTFTTTDADGRFRFTGIPDGRPHVALAPVAVVGDTPTRWRATQRGGSPSRFVLQQGSYLLLRRGFSSRLAGPLEVRVAAREGGQRGVGLWDAEDAVGLVLGLAPGQVYDVFLRHAGSGTAGLLVGLTSEMLAADATLSPARTIRARLDLPYGVQSWDVEGVVSYHELSLAIYADEDGSFELTLPADDVLWRLVFSTTVGGSRRQVTREIEPGEDDPLVLRLR